MPRHEAGAFFAVGHHSALNTISGGNINDRSYDKATSIKRESKPSSNLNARLGFWYHQTDQSSGP